MHDIPKVVFTGGPCAGKSTAMAAVSQYLSEQGFHPLIVQESATDLINCGLNPTSEEFQSIVLRRQLDAERQIMNAAQSGYYKNPVVLLDRGRNDGRAYCENKIFTKVLERHSITTVTARDVYAGVLHLVTAAYGAEAFYTTKNNEARYETLEEARIQDDKTREAWHGTPHLRIIENCPDETFQDKIHGVITELARILGIPEPLECERKFLLLQPKKLMLPESAVSIDIVQTYLISRKAGVVERVRARGQHDEWLFYNTHKEPRGHGLVSERDRIVDKSQYNNLLVREDTNLRRIHKTRHCFTHNTHYCELDVFHSHLEGQVELEIEINDITDPVDIPNFLGPVKEVTGDENYSNYAKAHIA